MDLGRRKEVKELGKKAEVFVLSFCCCSWGHFYFFFFCLLFGVRVDVWSGFVYMLCGVAL